MFYTLKEGFAGFRRARFSSFVSVSIISISLIIIGIFLIFVTNTKRVVDSIQERIELEIFIDNSLDSLGTIELRNQLETIEGIKSIKYVSKEQAVEYFKRQFDQDIFEILDENPLPASFQITLTSEYRTSQHAHQIIEKLEKMDGVDDVLFRQDILILLEKYMNISITIIVVFGGLLALGSIFLVSNTIKLIIISRIQIIETMKLVGATKHFIRSPFLVEGILQGISGSIFATAIVFGLLKLINIEMTDLIIVNNHIYLIIFGLGVFLGFLGSVTAIQRFLKF